MEFWLDMRGVQYQTLYNICIFSQICKSSHMYKYNSKYLNDMDFSQIDTNVHDIAYLLVLSFLGNERK